MIQKAYGFTLVEVLMTILLISILTVLSISEVQDTVEEDYFESTLQEMKEIRKSLIGDVEKTQGGKRSDFGYLGDVGSLPSAAQGIAALLTNPVGVSAFSVNTTYRIGSGWNGPYLSSGSLSQDWTTDAWGNAYVYDPSTSPATLTSKGADGATGGVGINQDIVIQIPSGLQTSTVTGVIRENNGVFSSDAEVVVRYPDGSGGLTSSKDTLVAADNGKFVFNNIPLGRRSIHVYIPSEASPTVADVGPMEVLVEKGEQLVAVTKTDISTGGGGGCGTVPSIVGSPSIGLKSSDGTSVTVTKPTGTTTGELLVAFHSTDGKETLTGPSGWTAVDAVIQMGSSTSSRVYYKVATAAEPANYNFTSGTSEEHVVAIVRITGFNSTNPIHGFGTAKANTIAPESPDVTTTLCETLVLRMMGIDTDAVIVDNGYPVGSTGLFVRKSSANSGATSLGVAYSTATSTGAVGAAIWTIAGVNKTTSWTVVVEPN